MSQTHPLEQEGGTTLHLVVGGYYITSDSSILFHEVISVLICFRHVKEVWVNINEVGMALHYITLLEDTNMLCAFFHYGVFFITCILD